MAIFQCDIFIGTRLIISIITDYELENAPHRHRQCVYRLSMKHSQLTTWLDGEHIAVVCAEQLLYRRICPADNRPECRNHQLLARAGARPPIDIRHPLYRPTPHPVTRSAAIASASMHRCKEYRAFAIATPAAEKKYAAYHRPRLGPGHSLLRNRRELYLSVGSSQRKPSVMA